ncbi:MAG: GNAT family N-acetyltransferase [Myxococcales bacterium]|nr:GNAT family N-acetyltransferase [Myxococcales bacterium]
MVEYQIVSGDACPEALFAFRYAVYVEELGRPQTHACHQTRRIIDPLDACGHNLIAWRDGAVVGAVRANFVRDGGTGSYEELYELDRLSDQERSTASLCTRYMVAPAQRRTRVSVELMKRIYRFGIQHGIRTSYLDTNPPYRRYYEKIGYEFLFEKTHPDYGRVSVMRLQADDLGKLRAARSPFAPIYEGYLRRCALEASAHATAGSGPSSVRP